MLVEVTLNFKRVHSTKKEAQIAIMRFGPPSLCYTTANYCCATVVAVLAVIGALVDLADE